METHLEAGRPAALFLVTVEEEDGGRLMGRKVRIEELAEDGGPAAVEGPGPGSRPATAQAPRAPKRRRMPAGLRGTLERRAGGGGISHAIKLSEDLPPPGMQRQRTTLLYELGERRRGRGAAGPIATFVGAARGSFAEAQKP